MNIKSSLLFCIGLMLMIVPIYTLRSDPVYITRSDSYHIVEEGDTLYSISRKYSISVEQLKLFNNMDSERIFVGQKIHLAPIIVAKSEYVTVRSIPENGYHTVQRGETVYRISKMYDLEIMDILEFNNLETFDIQAGQKIWLRPRSGEERPVITRSEEEEIDSEPERDKPVEKDYHIVQAGENLFRISLKYGMTVDRLRELNQLSDDNIYVGQRLTIVPGEPAKHIPPEPSVHLTKRTDLHLPLNGRIVSEFGIRNNMPHNGIDIAAPIGDPIYAALSGKVVFVGNQRGYGNVIVLEHDDYVMTVYAHNERNLVRLGEQIKKGQPIATVGQSGNASGPHLHFEYRVRGKAINPREVLPPF